MDKSQVWSKISEPTKSAWRTTAEPIINTLDALSPIAAPFAERWDREADRRMALRTPENLKALMTAQREHNSARSTSRQASAQRRIARKESKNPLSAGRRAARTATKAASRHQDAAKTDLKAARKNYPATLKTRAVQAHTLHVLPAGVSTYLMSTPADSVVWPVLTSVGLVWLNITALWLGRRSLTVHVDADASAEERALLERLQPEFWREHAEERGLTGTITARPKLTDAGITAAVRLDGTWTIGKLRSAEENIRALLGCRTSLRMQINTGDKGGWAGLTLRTRSAVDGADMRWTPQSVGLGLDTVTGDIVGFSPYTFRLVAGTTGMGKSVTMRPSMAEVLANPTGAVVFIDPKHQEYRLWGGKCRVEHEEQAIYDLVCELVAEMERRQQVGTSTTWTPTPEAPELVVFVDEGAAIVRMSKKKPFKDILDKFESLATMGRAARIWLTWATQYPTKEQGIPAQVVEMMLDRAALTVESSTADRTIFGEKAASKGWEPSELGGTPGVALVRTKAHRAPNPVVTWYLDDERAAELPAGIVWYGKTATATEAPVPSSVPAGRPALKLVKDGDFLLAPPDPTPAAEVPAARTTAASVDGTDARVLDAVTKLRPPVRQKDIVDTSGLPKGTVSRTVKRLVESGVLVREADGTVRPATAGEVSA